MLLESSYIQFVCTVSLLADRMDSSPDEKSSEWPHMDLSQAYTTLACNRWAFGFLGLNEGCFF